MVSKHNQYDLIRNRAYLKEYRIDNIIILNNNDFEGNMLGIKAYGKNRMFDCIQDTDAVYIPCQSGLDENEKNNLYEYAKRKRKEILEEFGCENSYLHNMGMQEQNVEVPIILISGMVEDIGKMDVALTLRKKFDEVIHAQAVIISHNEHAGLYGAKDIFRTTEKGEQGFNENIMRMRRMIARISEEEGADLVIIVLPGGLRNPYEEDNFETDLWALSLMRAVDIDYSIYIMPLNYRRKKDIEDQRILLKRQLNLECNLFALSDRFYNSAHWVHLSGETPMLMNADEKTLIECKSSILKIKDDHLYDKVIKDIVAEFEYKEGKYQIL